MRPEWRLRWTRVRRLTAPIVEAVRAVGEAVDRLHGIAVDAHRRALDAEGEVVRLRAAILKHRASTENVFAPWPEDAALWAAVDEGAPERWVLVTCDVHEVRFAVPECPLCLDGDGS